MNNKPKQYSCAQLGVCQSRPGCDSCSHNTEALPPGGFYFAPGTVEDCTPTRTDTVARGLLTAAAVAALAAAIGLSAGWITVGGLF